METTIRIDGPPVRLVIPTGPGPILGPEMKVLNADGDIVVSCSGVQLTFEAWGQVTADLLLPFDESLTPVAATTDDPRAWAAWPRQVFRCEILEIRTA